MQSKLDCTCSKGPGQSSSHSSLKSTWVYYGKSVLVNQSFQSGKRWESTRSEKCFPPQVKLKKNKDHPCPVQRELRKMSLPSLLFCSYRHVIVDIQSRHMFCEIIFLFSLEDNFLLAILMGTKGEINTFKAYVSHKIKFFIFCHVCLIIRVTF